jgi:hypothetical protein
MNGDNGYMPEGSGCVTWIIIALAAAGIFLMMGSGDSQTHVSADAELFSRNQANIASEVYNSFYDCQAAGSCVTFETTTSTSTTSTSTDITGDRNTVNNGLRLCVDANGAGYWTYELCGAGYTETTPPEGVTP